jgi:hypothetical protein
VRVELSQNGKTLTRERTISLSAGEHQDLTIDFGSTSVLPVALTSTN